MSERRPSLQFMFGDSDQNALVKLYDAIGAASVEFPPLPRTATGQVGKDRKFKYAPYHKVVQCIKRPLAEKGVSFIQPIHTEQDGKVSVTLIVTGHGAAIESTLVFKQDSDPKVLGADITYHKRYQLTSFFGLEGDPDADDFEDDVIERKAVVVEKPVAAKPAEADKAEVVASKPEAAKVESKTEPSAEAAMKADKRPIGEKLTDAMKQLVWKMKDFDAFCKEHREEFPDFVSAARLPPEKQQRLYELLVLHKGVVPL